MWSLRTKDAEVSAAAFPAVWRVPSITVTRQSKFKFIPSADAAISARLEKHTDQTTYAAADVSLRLVGQSIVDARSGIAVLRDGRTVQETAAVGRHFHRERSLSRLLARTITGQVVHCFHASPPYAHVLMDGLAVVAAISDRLVDGDLRLLVPRYLPKWARPMLIEMGVPERAMVSMSKVTKFTELVVSTGLDTRNTFLPSPQLLAGLRSHRAQSNPRRLYLRRPPGGSDRTIVNERETEAFLEDRGFEIVVPVGMSLRAQMELFGSAEVIVSAHGSGLANVIFAAKGAKIIDLMPEDWVDNWFENGVPERWMLNTTSALGQDYVLVLCASTMDGPPHRLCGVSHPIRCTVNLAALEQALAS